jgi:hypothetical protein
MLDYNNPELEKFLTLGRLYVDLDTLQTRKLPFSAFETSTGGLELDYPYDSSKVSLRPGFWYSANLTLGGELKKEVFDLMHAARSFVAESYGQYEISFMIVCPPGGKIPSHLHFRENNTVTLCIPSDKKKTGMTLTVGDSDYLIHNGVLNFDSKAPHAVDNTTESTYWIFVFENVLTDKHQPLMEVIEYDSEEAGCPRPFR